MTTTQSIEILAEVLRTEAPKRNRYSNRDRLGRFVKVVHVQQLEVEGGWVNDDAGETHGHARCGNLKGRTFEVAAEAGRGGATGWLCSSCIEVSRSVVSLWVEATANVAPTVGTKVCATCHAEKRLRSFPTFVDMGFRERADTCRKCESARRVVEVPVAA